MFESCFFFYDVKNKALCIGVVLKGKLLVGQKESVHFDLPITKPLYGSVCVLSGILTLVLKDSLLTFEA